MTRQLSQTLKADSLLARLNSLPFRHNRCPLRIISRPLAALNHTLLLDLTLDMSRPFIELSDKIDSDRTSDFIHASILEGWLSLSVEHYEVPGIYQTSAFGPVYCVVIVITDMIPRLMPVYKETGHHVNKMRDARSGTVPKATTVMSYHSLSRASTVESSTTFGRRRILRSKTSSPSAAA